MNTKDATFAIYRNQDEIKVAIHSFVKLGFNKSALWAFQSKRNGSKDFSQVQKYQFKNGAIIGAAVGAILIGGFFMFVDKELIGSRLIMIFVGIFIGALLGAAGGFLVGIGTPDPAAKRYGQYLQSGGILLSVHSENPKQIQQAQEVLTETGGQDIQLINELKTWDDANLERINLEKLQPEIMFEI
jgi:uncharacterized membrane protein